MSNLAREWLRVARLSTTRHKQSGFATVEFALTIPLAVMIVALCVWLIGLATMDLRLHSAASTAARILARGDLLPQEFIDTVPEQAQIDVTQGTTLVRITIRMTARSPIPAFPIPITMNASAVAAREDVLSGS